MTLILSGLRDTLATRMAADRALAPLLLLLWARLHRAAARFARLAHLVALGGRPPVPRNRPPGRSGRPDCLPRGVTWLIRLVPEAAPYGAQLQALMAAPAMAPLFAAAPQAARILRPLCRMLAADAGPARPRPAASRTPAPPPAEPLLPATDAPSPPLVLAAA